MNSKDEIDKVYAHLSPRADKLYQFVMAYSDYINEAKDYGTGLLISMVKIVCPLKVHPLPFKKNVI